MKQKNFLQQFIELIKTKFYKICYGSVKKATQNELTQKDKIEELENKITSLRAIGKWSEMRKKEFCNYWRDVNMIDYENLDKNEILVELKKCNINLSERYKNGSHAYFNDEKIQEEMDYFFHCKSDIEKVREERRKIKLETDNNNQ